MDIKKAAWSAWRSHRVPTVEVVQKGSNHFTFAQTQLSSANDGLTLHVPAFYLLTWFQRFLLADASATKRLFVTTPALPSARDAYLSTSFRSAAYLPGAGVDCANFRQATCRTPVS